MTDTVPQATTTAVGVSAPAPLGRGLAADVGSLQAPAEGALQALSLMARLKRTRRTGWVDSGVADPESIADHSQRCAMCALLVAAEDPSLDRNKLVQMALVHDVGESLVGDVTPSDTHISHAAKAAAEDAAFRRLDALAGTSAAAPGLHALWREFEDGQTPEARVVQQLDKFEMILSACEYERAQPGLDLSRFFAATRGLFVHPVIARWAAQVEAQRPNK